MTWADFRQWAFQSLGYRVQLYPPFGAGPAWRAIWGHGDAFARSRAHTGSGFPAVYGPLQQRRLALWLRARGLIAQVHLGDWLDAGETYDDGWLINDGAGIRWVADPTEEWKELLNRGFIAVKCGIGSSAPEVDRMRRHLEWKAEQT